MNTAYQSFASFPSVSIPAFFQRGFLAIAALCGITAASFNVVGAETNALVIQRDVVYGDSNEPMHRSDIYFPKALRSQPDRKIPAILMIHGGAWTLGDKGNDASHARKLAQRGYCVIAINYRLAPANKFPAQLKDCELAMRWIHDHASERQIDLDRVGVWGYSAGAHLAALLATHPENVPVRIRASVCGGGPFDLTRFPPDTRALNGVFGGTPRQKPDVYRDASPLFSVSDRTPPMFLFHGSKDIIVPFSNSTEMHERLKALQIPTELVTLEGKGHLLSFLDKSAIEGSFDFLDTHLNQDSTWLSVPDKPQ